MSLDNFDNLGKNLLVLENRKGKVLRSTLFKFHLISFQYLTISVGYFLILSFHHLIGFMGAVFTLGVPDKLQWLLHMSVMSHT